jgi:hypothetical protein
MKMLNKAELKERVDEALRAYEAAAKKPWTVEAATAYRTWRYAEQAYKDAGKWALLVTSVKRFVGRPD